MGNKASFLPEEITWKDRVKGTTHKVNKDSKKANYVQLEEGSSNYERVISYLNLCGYDEMPELKITKISAVQNSFLSSNFENYLAICSLRQKENSDLFFRQSWKLCDEEEKQVKYQSTYSHFESQLNKFDFQSKLNVPVCLALRGTDTTVC
jgi:hypothetical protein